MGLKSRTKKKVLVSGERIELQSGRDDAVNAVKKKEVEDGGASRQLLQVIIWFMLGIIMPRASVYGSMAPFGISFASVVPGIGAVGAYIASMLGYMIPGGSPLQLKYLAALVAVAGIKWALAGIPSISKHPVYAPVLSFFSVGFTGIALSVMNGPDVYVILLVVAEALLAAGAAFFFSITVELITGERLFGVLSAAEQAGVVMTGAVVLMAVSSFTFGGISPGRAAAGIIVLLLARCGKEQSGGIAGIILGAAMALTSPGHAYVAVAFAVGGLTAGIFARFGKLASSGAFLISCLITSANTGDSILILTALYEAGAACIIFIAIPASVNRIINRFFLHVQDIPAVEGLRRSVVMRLDHASSAMTEVAQTVDVVSQKLSGLSAPDLGSVYQSVSGEICRVCGLKMYCWEREFNNTMSAFNELTPALRKKGEISAEDVPHHLSKHCSRMSEVVSKINSEYSAFTVREGAFRRLSEIRAVVSDQFLSMSELLSEMSADFAMTERVDADAAIRVISACEEFGLIVRDAICLVGHSGHVTVEVLALDEGVKIPRERFIESLSDACGRQLSEPVIARYESHVKIKLTERPDFKVISGSAQLHCGDEKLCGDAFDIIDEGGRWYAVLSDGMGSGGRAAVDGAMAAGLTSRLVHAGFGHDSALRLVNSALLVKSGDESLATLDIAEIDRYNGRLTCRKAGASPSLLCSKGRVSRIENSSLPVGILRDIKSEITEDTLTDGDILVMFSDGAMPGGLGWIEELLREYDMEKGSMQKLAGEIAASARLRQEEHEDDITVIAMQLVRTI